MHVTDRSTPTAGHDSIEPSPTGIDVTPATVPRRRFALRVLDEFAYPIELHTLATHVVALGEGVPLAAVDDAARERMAVRLHHVDVPALVDAGLVAYDHESRMAVRTDAHTRDRYVGTEADSRRSDVA